MIGWRLRMKITRDALCCAQLYAHNCEQLIIITQKIILIIIINRFA